MSEWKPEYNEPHNERRRERYATDPAYREEQRQRSRDARAKNRSDNGNLLKEYNGQMVEVFKIKDIAEACGVTVTRVRSAFQRGRLPESSFGGKHIYVTAEQIELIKYAFDNPILKDEVIRAELDKEW